jgi:hypothetical protein
MGCAAGVNACDVKRFGACSPYGLPRNIVITSHVVHLETVVVSTNRSQTRNGMAQNCEITATIDIWLIAWLRYVRISMFMTA